MYKLIFGNQLFRESPGGLTALTDGSFSFSQGPWSKHCPRYSKVDYYQLITHPV